MSIKVTSYVWENSNQRGAQLLLLLAIADNANDQGEAFPAVPTLAKKTRSKTRNTQALTKKLEDAGELIVQEREGTSNLYIIPVPWRNRAVTRKRKTQPAEWKGGMQKTAPLPMQDAASPTHAENCIPGYAENNTGGYAETCMGGMQKSAYEPLLNRQSEPYKESPAANGEGNGSDFEVSVKLQLYAVTDKDIASMIAAWWQWVPMRPVKNGAVAPEHSHYANPSNRETARNLLARGIGPADMIEFLGEVRSDPDSRWAYLKTKAMTFTYVTPICEEWVQADREKNYYTREAPRIVARKPGTVIPMSELLGLTAAEINAQFPDLCADVPPLYITPHQAAGLGGSQQ